MIFQGLARKGKPFLYELAKRPTSGWLNILSLNNRRKNEAFQV
jgi:hypothetical protein